MAEVAADVWVLTETHLHHAPTADHAHSAFSAPHPDRRPDTERWAALWSRWPITTIDDPPSHRRGTVACIVHRPDAPFLVYGTVIAWANEPTFDDGRPARMWQVHLAEIERQGAEWQRLRELHPDLPVIVAGDFNQDRDGSGWYGTAAGRQALSQALADAGLRCVTDMDAVETGKLATAHLIDHVCLTPDLPEVIGVSCWEPQAPDGSVLSDHPIVAVDLPD